MKKIKFSKKLSLKKETISRLNDNQMKNLKAGARTNFRCHDPSGLKSDCCEHSYLFCNSYGCMDI